MKTKTANSTVHFFNFLNGSAAKAVPIYGYATLEIIAKSAKKKTAGFARAASRRRSMRTPI